MSNNKETNTNIGEEVNSPETKEPSIAELMAMMEAQAKELAELKAAKVEIKAVNPKRKKDPFKDLEDFELPLSQYEFDDVSACVNGRHYQIKRGHKVRIPKCIKRAILESQQQDFATFNKIRALVEKTPNL